MTRKPVIIGNWKMNAPPSPVGFVTDLASARRPLDGAGVVICPPATLIALLSGRGVRIGAQNCHAEPKGAHTGDIAAELLAAAGASHVIVGHSERRQAYGETDGEVRAKAVAANRAGLTAIICVGETAAERDAGDAATVVRGQIAAALFPGIAASNAIFAYEPVWAIGAGAAAGVDEIEAMHGEIRDELSTRLSEKVAGNTRILYGGSMNGANAGAILALDNVDGGLVGGASLDLPEFLKIAESA